MKQLRAWETAQVVKYLPNKHEDLGSDPQEPTKKNGAHCNASLGEAEAGGFPPPPPIRWGMVEEDIHIDL